MSCTGFDYILNYSLISFAHQEQSHFIFRHGFQVRNREGLGEGCTSSKSLCRLYCGGETVQPCPLAGAPYSDARLRWAVSKVGRHRGTAQKLVQMETYSQRGKALHVRAVDKLLPTYNMGLEVESKERHY